MLQELLTYPDNSSSSMHSHVLSIMESSTSRQQHSMAVCQPPTA
jgi:hypothetical protein